MNPLKPENQFILIKIVYSALLPSGRYMNPLKQVNLYTSTNYIRRK